MEEKKEEGHREERENIEEGGKRSKQDTLRSCHFCFSYASCEPSSYFGNESGLWDWEGIDWRPSDFSTFAPLQTVHCLLSKARARFPPATGVCLLQPAAECISTLQSTNAQCIPICISGLPTSIKPVQCTEIFFCKWLMVWEPTSLLLGQSCHFWSVWKHDNDIKVRLPRVLKTG